MSLKVQLNPTRRRNESGELDVFGATEYFSDFNEVVGYNGAFLSQKAMREERQAWGGRRMSMDMQATASHSHRVDNLAKEEKQKVPSSPGGRIASFLRTLFHQTAAKKKKSMSSTTQSMKCEEEIPDVGRRRRRSSMSLFQSIKNNESKAVYASSTSCGFRTPPRHVDNQIKKCKDLRSCSDHKHMVSLPKYNGNYVKSVTSKDESLDGKKFNFIDGFSMKDKNMRNKDRIWVLPEKKNAKMSIEVDDGGDSDSSSDLFELKNHDLSAR